MTPILILDIDGTLADTSHREYLLQQYCVSCGGTERVNSGVSFKCVNCDTDIFVTPPKSWEAFNNPAVVSMDKPFPSAQAAIKGALRGYEKFFITGRQERLRLITSNWLAKHFDVNVSPNNLLMRPSHNFTASVPASVYKRQKFLELINTLKNRNPSVSPTSCIAFDDDEYCLAMYSDYCMAIRASSATWDLFNHQFPSTPETSVAR